MHINATRFVNLTFRRHWKKKLRAVNVIIIGAGLICRYLLFLQKERKGKQLELKDIFVTRIDYGENVDEIKAEGRMETWICPYCRNLCNCSFCRFVSCQVAFSTTDLSALFNRKYAGYPPTGALAQQAIKRGFHISGATSWSILNKRDKEAYKVLIIFICVPLYYLLKRTIRLLLKKIVHSY